MRDLSAQGLTMLVVTHEMGFARDAADRVILLDGGKIVEADTPESFFNNPKTERTKRFLARFSQ